MNKFYLKSIIILIISNILFGCQSLKDGLEGNKKSKSAEEFLIEKKNPLVLPPDCGNLPVPENIENIKTNNDTSKNIITLNKEDLSNKSTTELWRHSTRCKPGELLLAIHLQGQKEAFWRVL